MKRGLRKMTRHAVTEPCHDVQLCSRMRAPALFLLPRSEGPEAVGARNVRDRCAKEQDLRAAAPDCRDKPTAEQRREARIIAGRAGWIAFQKGVRLRECFVGDESDNGAQITVNAAANLPLVFYLYFSAHFVWRRYCRVTWRSGDKLGVEFLL
jgi:hypothetical protein